MKPLVTTLLTALCLTGIAFGLGLIVGGLVATFRYGYLISTSALLP